MIAFMQGSSSPVRSSLDWDDVRLFLVLYRARTMAEAAATLAVNPSTVSRRLVNLEEALDTALFDRGRDGLRPTPAADDLIATAELVEHGVAQFAHSADRLERDVSGLVRMTCPPDVADVVVLPVVRRLAKLHPALRISLEPGEAMVDLNRREADLALRIVRPTRGDLVFKRVLDVTWVPATSKALATRLGRVADVSTLPWIGWGERYRSTPACRWVDNHIHGEPILRTDSLTTQIAAAKAGIGVALVPSPSLSHHRLCAIEIACPTEPLPQDELFLVTHRALQNVPRVRALWDALLKHLAALEPG
jgi:DNA-binding transcriptional LysR family regulator